MNIKGFRRSLSSEEYENAQRGLIDYHAPLNLSN